MNSTRLSLPASLFRQEVEKLQMYLLQKEKLSTGISNKYIKLHV